MTSLFPVCCSASCGDVTESRDDRHDNGQQVPVARQQLPGSDDKSRDVVGRQLILSDDVKLAADDVIDDVSDDVMAAWWRRRVDELVVERDSLLEQLDSVKSALDTEHDSSHMSVIYFLT